MTKNQAVKSNRNDLQIVQDKQVSPVEMIKMALQGGGDLDNLEKYIELQERYEANQAKKAYAIAMAETQKAMPIVVKDSFNNQTNSKYAKEEAISKAIKPIYTEHGFSLSFDIADSPLPDHIRVLCHILHSAGHTENRHIDYPYDIAGIKGTVNKTPIHAYKSTISYAKNTLTCMAFNVATGDDNDGNISEIEYISEEQLSKMLDILDNLPNSKEKKEKFLNYMNVKSIDKINVKDYNKGMEALKSSKDKADRKENKQ